MSQVEEITLDAVYAEEQVEEPEVVTEEVKAEATEEPAEEPVKTEPEVETTSADTAEKPKTDWTFSQAMDEREKRQKFETENKDLKAKLAEFEKTDDVSVFEDEKGYTEQQALAVDQKLLASELRISRAYAVREFGEEKVAASEKWYAEEGMKSPHAIDRINKTGLKFHEAVILMDEEQARLDPESYKASIREEVEAEFKAKAESSEEPRKTITPSLASARSAGDQKTSTGNMEDILNP